MSLVRKGTMKSKFVLQMATKARCPECKDKRLLLLIREDGEIGTGTNNPAFYFCNCGATFQVGVGPVTKADRGENTQELPQPTKP